MTIETRTYSAMLYSLADDIDSEEGYVMESAEPIREAAQRLDEQTVTIRSLIKQRDDLLAALEKCRKELSAWMRDHGDDMATQEAVADARAAIASVKGGAA